MASPWPTAVLNDLNNRYFAESASQIGTEETNDFVFGALQNALRQALFDGISNSDITDAIPNNTAYVAVHFGFEVQIDENGAPDGADQHRTGAIYGEPGQNFSLQKALPVGQWNQYEIRVQDQSYAVLLNGVQVTQFANPHPGRGLPTRPDAPSFIGLQAHTGTVAFRNLELEALSLRSQAGSELRGQTHLFAAGTARRAGVA